MNRRSFKGALFGSAAATVLLAAVSASPAAAQVQPTPPTHYTPGPQGVDMVSGTYNHSVMEVAIGDPNAGGLTFGRIFLGSGGWRDLNIGTISFTSSPALVSAGPISEPFIWNGTSWISKFANGSTMVLQTGITIVTDSRGNVATFTNEFYFNRTPWGLPGEGPYLLSYKTANGVKTDYHYVTEEYCTEYNPKGQCILPVPATRLQSITNNLGYQLKYTYQSDSTSDVESWLRLKSVTGINNAVDYCNPSANSCPGLTRNWPSVTLSNQDNPLTSTDQSGRVTTYTFTGFSGGLIDSVRYPGSTSDDINIDYDVSQTVVAATDASGAWSYAFTDSGGARTAVASGPLGQTQTVISDLTTGRPVTVSNAAGETLSYQYDAHERVTRVTASEGSYTQFTYDGRGNISQTTSVAKPGSGLANIVTSAAYPPTCSNPVTCNLPTSTTDATGAVTDYTWDSTHGGPLTITAPAPTAGAARPQTRIAYAAQTAQYKNSSGVIVAAPSSVILPGETSACATGTSCDGTADEVLTTVAYGSAGVANNLRPTSVSRGSGVDPAMATTAVTYTPEGDVATVDGPLAGSDDTTRYRYDSARQVVGVVGPDPDGAGAGLNRAQRLTYNSRGQVTLAETGTTPGYTDPNWSAFNPLVRDTTVYDDRGRPGLIGRQTGAGATVSVQQVSYDAAGRPDCMAIRMNPATWGSLPPSACTATTAGSDGPDRISRATYDAVGRPLTTTTAYGLAEAITESVTYAANGRASTLTDGNGNVSIQVYDGFDRPVRLRYPNPAGGGTSSTDYEQTDYDIYGRTVSGRNRAGQVTTLALDNLGRVTAIDAPSGTMDLAYTYDNLGRTLTSTGGGQTLTYAWDPLSRLTSEAGPLGAMSYQYDAAGRPTRITWPDAVYAQYDRDRYGAVTAIRENGATSGAGVLATYAYNDLGQRTGMARGAGPTTAWSYDAAGRMTGLSHDLAGAAYDVTFGYTWSAAGQIAGRTVSNPAYVYTLGVGSTAYANDGLNRTTSVGGTAVTYDANQNIAGALGNSYGYDAAGQLTTATIAGAGYTFQYDPAGRLFVGVGGRFQYAGAQLTGEYDWAGALTSRHVPGPGLDEPVATIYVSGVKVQQVADERGSVIAMAEAGGPWVGVNRYDEYGVPAPANDSRFQYTGQAWMAPGLYHYRARAYAPQLGRFLQTDPIGYDEGPNLYAYVGLDPINFVDPTGLGRWRMVCVTQPVSEQGETGEWEGTPGGVEVCTRTWDPTGTASGSGGVRSGIFGPWNGTGSYFPGAGVQGPPIQTDPQYAPFRAAYQQATDENSWMWIPVLAPVAVPLVAEGLLAATSWTIRGGELRNIMSPANWRINFLGHRGQTGPGRLPHYHRRGPGGIRAHRPWERGW